MIPEKTIREEKFNATIISLENRLEDIPMTRDCRDRIEDTIYQIKTIFREANEQ